MAVNAAAYGENSEFWTVHLSLTTTAFKTSCKNKHLDKVPYWLSAVHQEQLQSAVMIVRAWLLTVAVLVLLQVLLTFDVALPDVTINIESDDRTRTQLKVLYPTISAPNFDFKQILSWFWSLSVVRVVDLIFSYDMQLSVEGVNIACKGVKSTHRTDITHMIGYLHSYRHGMRGYQPSEQDNGTYENNDWWSKAKQYYAGPIVSAHAVDVREIDIQLDPTLVPASLYLLIKDICTSTHAANRCSTSDKEYTARCSTPMMGVLVNVRRFTLIVRNIVPSEVYELSMRSCMYKLQPTIKPSLCGATCQWKLAMVVDEGCTEHNICLAELVLHSYTQDRGVYSHSSSPTKRGSIISNTIQQCNADKGGVTESKVLHLQVNNVTGFCTTSTDSGVRNTAVDIDMQLRFEYLYVRPAAQPANAHDEQGPAEREQSDGDTVILRSTAQLDMRISAALIVYNKFTSLFASVC